MTNKIKGLILFTFILATSTLVAQRLSISLDRDSILIGDHVILSIEAVVPEKTEVFFPEFGDTLGLFDVIETLPLDTVEDKIVQDIIITQFDSGYYQLDGVPALFVYEETKVDTLYSDNPIFLYVNTVPVDTAAAIKPIKPEREVPWTWTDVKNYVYIGIGIIVLIIALVIAYVYYERKKQPAKAPPKTMLDYYQDARKQLNDLERKQLWQKGEIKEYYLEISEITRTYLEGRFGIQAMESTTDEIVSDLYFDENLKKKLKEILSQADLAKFAKFKPEGAENIRILKMTKDFVAHTKPKNQENND